MERAYEDEDDIEEILPLAFAFVVFNASNFEVVLPSRFWWVYRIWNPSDWFAIVQVHILSGDSAIEKGELRSHVGIIAYLLDRFFCALARGIGSSTIAPFGATCDLSASTAAS